MIIVSAPKKISATEAARSFSDVVARVHYRGEEFVVEKGSEAVCKISPVGQGATKSTIVVARVHARLWAELASSGVTLGAHDLIIGATALACGWPVATRDTRSFAKIPGLEVQVWK